MIEYLLTDLPRYVKTAPRGNFANSVVKEGAVLLFSEDGETLVAKHPDGTFSEIGSGSSGGTSAEYYKCASVTPGVSGAVIEVTGDTTYGCNGTYTIVDATATGKNRTWRTSDGLWEIRNTNSTLGIDRWVIWDITSDAQKILANVTETDADPWEISSWMTQSPTVYLNLVLTPTDSTNTWSGYKAVWGDNGYTISDDLTEGLVYSGMTPQVGTIYDSTCSVKVISLYNSSAKEPVNPFFYSPFTEDLQKEVDPGFKDWGISDISKASFEIVDGISCLKLNNTGLGCDINSKWYTGEHAISFSFGLRLTETHTARKLLMFFDSNDGYDGYGIAVTGTSLQMCGKENSYNVGDAVPLVLNTWYHILMTYSIGGLWQLYVNGELKASGTNTINISYNRYQFCFGNYIWDSSYRNINACLTRVRIYDYVISDPLEMKWLMQEIGVS